MANPDAVACLLLAYGTPDSVDGAECFLMDIMGGRRPSPEAVADLERRYEAIGGVSPLTRITQAQADGVAADVARRGRPTPVYVGMRHWSPRIEATLRRIVADGIHRIGVLILAPHACDLTEQTYRTAFDRALASIDAPLEVAWTGPWSRQPGLVEAQADLLRDALAQVPDGVMPHVVFSAHSLPERIVDNGDPYPDDLLANSRAIADAAGIRTWSFAWQSAGRRGGPWLGPDINDHLRHLAAEGERWVVSMPIGFVCDHLEILYDLDIESRQVADELGLGFTRVDAPNTHPHFLAAIADALGAVL